METTVKTLKLKTMDVVIKYTRPTKEEIRKILLEKQQKQKEEEKK